MTLLATLSHFTGFGRISKISFAQHRNLVKQRRDLARLSPEQLKDIGLTEAQAHQEAGRAIWDAPTFWYK